MNDNNWHQVAIDLDRSANLKVYLDGASRGAPKLTAGTPGSALYDISKGTLRLGYFKVRQNLQILDYRIQNAAK